MSAVSVTAAEVLPIAGSTQIDKELLFGAAVTAGQAVYKDTATSPATWKLADANLSATAALVSGIALNSGAIGQVAAVAIGGTIDPGFTVTVGEVYVLGATAAGDINPVADLTTGWYTNIVGLGITASILKLVFANSGVAHS